MHERYAVDLLALYYISNIRITGGVIFTLQIRSSLLFNIINLRICAGHVYYNIFQFHTECENARKSYYLIKDSYEPSN